MFMVFRKDKIVSYLISLSTVAFLFMISFAMINRNNETVTTSTNILDENQIENSNNIVNEANTLSTSLNEINGNITKKLQK